MSLYNEMSYKKKCHKDGQNKEIWIANSVDYETSIKRRSQISNVDSSTAKRNHLPRHKYFAGRYLFIEKLVNGVMELWNEMNFLHLSKQVRNEKFNKVLKKYGKFFFDYSESKFNKDFR